MDRKVFLFLFPILLFNNNGAKDATGGVPTSYQQHYTRIFEDYLLMNRKENTKQFRSKSDIAINMKHYLQQFWEDVYQFSRDVYETCFCIQLTAINAILFQVLYSYSHAFCFDIKSKMLIFANKWNSLLRMVEIIYEQKLNLIDNVMSQSLFRFEGIFNYKKIFNFMIDIIWAINTIKLSQFERHCNLFCFYTLYYYYGNLLFMSRYR